MRSPSLFTKTALYTVLAAGALSLGSVGIAAESGSATGSSLGSPSSDEATSGNDSMESRQGYPSNGASEDRAPSTSGSMGAGSSGSGSQGSMGGSAPDSGSGSYGTSPDSDSTDSGFGSSSGGGN